MRRSGPRSAEMLGPDDDHATVQQHDRVHEHGRALVLGGRRTRTDAVERGWRRCPARRHTAVPVERGTAVGGRRGVGTDTGDRAVGVRGRRRGRAAAQRGRQRSTKPADVAATIRQSGSPAQQQRE